MLKGVPRWCPLCGNGRLHVEFGRITTLSFKDGQKTHFPKANTLKTLYCLKCGAIGSSSTNHPEKIEIDESLIEQKINSKTPMHVNCEKCNSFLHTTEEHPPIKPKRIPIDLVPER